MKLAIVTIILCATQAFASTPCKDEAHVRLTLIESPAPWLECAAIAAEHGAHLAALGMMVSPNPACAVWGPGRGWIVSVPGVADFVIGREARHALLGEDYVIAGIPIFGECR